jgi:dTDP-4-dehydrorhamnose reductase
VYSGARGAYQEDDPHDALDVYGKTKSLGEVPRPRVYHLRCSIVGPEPKEGKFLLEWFCRQPRRGRVQGYANHLWNGVTTLQFARVAQAIITRGLDLPVRQHLVPAGVMTKAELLHQFARCYGREDVEIESVAAEHRIDRTLGTRRPEINRALWAAAGYAEPPGIPEMILEASRYTYRMAGLVAAA